MKLDSGDRGSLPIACTLGPVDGSARLLEWRRVADDAGVGKEFSTGRVILRFRDGPGIGDRLQRLVSAERDCCAFLEWKLLHDGTDLWLVEIAGSDEELGSLPLTH
jgi:hypothetical protein